MAKRQTKKIEGEFMPTIKERGWQHFLELCQKARSLNELNELFQFLLTPEERDAMATRVELVSALLKAEKTQRDIAAELGISIAKITRGSNALKVISDSLHKFLRRHLFVK